MDPPAESEPVADVVTADVVTAGPQGAALLVAKNAGWIFGARGSWGGAGCLILRRAPAPSLANERTDAGESGSGASLSARRRRPSPLPAMDAASPPTKKPPLPLPPP
jgi:hypothetical protein